MCGPGLVARGKNGGMQTLPPLSPPRGARWPWAALALCAALLAAPGAQAKAPFPAGAQLKACWLPGVETQAWCGVLRRPLDPARPDGPKIDLNYAVLPAIARNKKPDPVMFFAGGPGQSAIELSGSVGRMLARLGNRRDLILIDQRGTGRSAPLRCDDPADALRPLGELLEPGAQAAQLRECREHLQQLPHGDLRFYTTTIAMQDADAVRQALGVSQVNLVGGSYGTRAALEYMRQFPQTVRRAVLDGLAPPDMVLPASFAPDAQAALEGMLAACAAEPACSQRFPALRDDLQKLLQALPRAVATTHPLTGMPETITLTRETALNLLRAPMYAPALAAALPFAVHEAAQGRFTPLLGLGSALGGGSRRMALAMGMHFSVVCAEDLPRLDSAREAAAPVFGSAIADLYRRSCADWPRGEVPAGFYELPPAPAATLLLSGGADPATPPRHGERVAAALGERARHVVVAQAAHGVMGIGCMRDLLFRFIDAASDAEALRLEADCAASIPRPGAFLPPQAAAPSPAGGAR